MNVVYVQEFIGHSVNGNEFMMAPPAGTRKHVIQPHVDAQEKAKSMSGLISDKCFDLKNVYLQIQQANTLSAGWSQVGPHRQSSMSHHQIIFGFASDTICYT